jgi:dynactin complex subunit
MDADDREYFKLMGKADLEVSFNLRRDSAFKKFKSLCREVDHLNEIYDKFF